MDTRYDIINELKQMLREKPVNRWAAEFGVTFQTANGKNKGWVGQTLDLMSKTSAVNAQIPDGVDYELKSVHGTIDRFTGMWKPKETMAITMLSLNSILEETFETSAVWHKLHRLILANHIYDGENRSSAKVVKIIPLTIADPQLIQSIKEYWELIQNEVRQGRICEYSSRGTSSGYVQVRTKGSGKPDDLMTCPKTGKRCKRRAFYATKKFLAYVLGT